MFLVAAAREKADAGGSKERRAVEYSTPVRVIPRVGHSLFN